MATPIQPEVCMTTGRLLTEWFEFPEYTDEQLFRMACDHHDVDYDTRPKLAPKKPFDENSLIANKITSFVSARKRTKWVHGMTQQEVQARMNEATKMVNPDNFKFLPDDVRERTGLEINPLWMMETLVRSGLLTPKEQVAALRDLAQYTHSKAATISHNTHSEVKPEDWLLELAKEEYRVVEEGIELRQPMTPVERGSSKRFESKTLKRTHEVKALQDFGSGQLAEYEAMFTDDD